MLGADWPWIALTTDLPNLFCVSGLHCSIPAFTVPAIVMITKIKRGMLFCSFAGLFVLAGAAFARDLVELESKYLGDGLFQYTLTFPDGRYFQNIKLNALNVPFAKFDGFGESSTNWSAGATTP